MNHYAVASIVVFSLAALLGICGLLTEYGWTLHSIVLRSPIQILPKHLVRPGVSTADQLEVEFSRFKQAFYHTEGVFEILKSVYDFNEKVVRKEHRQGLFQLSPHPYRITTTTEEQYAIAKTQMWDALQEFVEIYRHLT